MIRTHMYGYIRLLSEADIDQLKNNGIARVIQIEKIDEDNYICELADEENFNKIIRIENESLNTRERIFKWRW